MSLKTGRILSIQSHVVSGYVGNRAAAFPLQVLGWDVDIVNTVQYSNHAGYRRLGGSKTSPSDLQSIFEGLDKNGLLKPSRLLTGYIPSAESLSVVANLVRDLRARYPELIYLLDPVMGDDGRLYVAPEVLPIYRDALLPLATIITPNWFEVELLTGHKLDSLENLRNALRILHQELHVPNVVISSIPLSSTLRQGLPPSLFVPEALEDETYSGEILLCLCSSIIAGSPESEIVSTVNTKAIRRIRGYFSGVGDIFSSIVVGHFSPETPHPLPRATFLALSTTLSVLLKTHLYSLTLPPEEKPETDEEKDAADIERRVKRMRGRELRIIQSIDEIRNAEKEGGSLAEWEGFWEDTLKN